MRRDLGGHPGLYSEYPRKEALRLLLPTTAPAAAMAYSTSS